MRSRYGLLRLAVKHRSEMGGTDMGKYAWLFLLTAVLSLPTGPAFASAMNWETLDAEFAVSYACPKPGTATACEGGNAGECRLVDLSGTFTVPEDKDLQYNYLLNLLKRYHVKGLTSMEAEVKRRLSPLVSGRAPSLPEALEQARLCWQEQALATLASLEKAAGEQTLNRLFTKSQIAWTRARIGDEDGAYKQIAELRAAIAKFRAAGPQQTGWARSIPQEEWRAAQMENPLMPLARAAAQLGRYGLALELLEDGVKLDGEQAAEAGEYRLAVQSINNTRYPRPDEERALFAQIAAHRGDLDQIAGLMGADLRPGNFMLLWRQYFVHRQAVRVLVERGGSATAQDWAARWNAWDPASSSASMPPRLRVHRMIALTMAKQDPLAALQYLVQHERKDGEGNDCDLAIAYIGAQSGLPGPAQQIAEASSERAARAKQVGVYSTRDLFASTETQIALAYLEKGEAGQADAIFERAVSLLESGQDDTAQFLASRLARFSPERAGAYMDKMYAKATHKDDRWQEQLKQLWLWESRVAYLASRGRVSDALALSDRSEQTRRYAKYVIKANLAGMAPFDGVGSRVATDLATGCPVEASRAKFQCGASGKCEWVPVAE